MDVDIATFEARAEEAERRLATLELKISEGATVPAAPAGDAAAGDEFKKKFYDQLVALRLELGKSRVERAATEAVHPPCMILTAGNAVTHRAPQRQQGRPGRPGGSARRVVPCVRWMLHGGLLGGDESLLRTSG